MLTNHFPDDKKYTNTSKSTVIDWEKDYRASMLSQ